MTQAIEVLGAYFSRNGHPEVGADLQRVADTARQQGLPEVLSPAVDLKTQLDQLSEHGLLSDRGSLILLKGIETGFLRISNVIDLCGIDDASLRDISGLGPKRLEEIRGLFPYTPLVETMSPDGIDASKQQGVPETIFSSQVVERLAGLEAQVSTLTTMLQGVAPTPPDSQEQLGKDRIRKERIEKQLLDLGFLPKDINLILRALDGALAHITDARDLCRVSDSVLISIRNFGPKVLSIIRTNFPYTEQVFPESE